MTKTNVIDPIVKHYVELRCILTGTYFIYEGVLMLKTDNDREAVVVAGCYAGRTQKLHECDLCEGLDEVSITIGRTKT